MADAATADVPDAPGAAPLLDEHGQPISKSEFKRRQKLAEKEKDKAAKAAAKAAAAPAAEAGAGGKAAGAKEEELSPQQ